MRPPSWQSVKRRLEGYPAYRAARAIERGLRKRLGSTESLVDKVVHLKPAGASRGSMLLSFITEPFVLTPDQAGLYGPHPAYWAAREIADIFLDLGYDVDVIRWNNTTFVPTRDYAFFIDLRLNLDRIGPLLDRDCVKIMYVETAHWLFHMTAQHNRLLALQQRRGITLPPYKTVAANWGIERADCATVLGNDFVTSTYRYAGKPLYRVPVISPITRPWPQGKDFDACRRHFLWLGSGGMVHKGLDLVLEAFAGMPDYHLTVCGPLEQEKQFAAAYHRELYETPNIHTRGWVRADSDEFLTIADRCVGLVYPSCSEAGGGSVATCMHAGMIPLVSYESSVDVSDDFGVILKSSSIDAIQDHVGRISELPAHDLRQMARGAWEFARAQYTRERFAVEFRKVIETIRGGGLARFHPVDQPGLDSLAE